MSEPSPFGWFCEYGSREEFLRAIRFNPGSIFVWNSSFFEPWQGPLPRALRHESPIRITNSPGRNWAASVWLDHEGKIKVD